MDTDKRLFVLRKWVERHQGENRPLWGSVSEGGLTPQQTLEEIEARIEAGTIGTIGDEIDDVWKSLEAKSHEKG